MRTPAIIRTPFPTAEQVAERIGMSRSRLKEILQLADSIIAKRQPVTNHKDTKRSAASKKRAVKTSRFKKK
jgi:hypothetical protein